MAGSAVVAASVGIAVLACCLLYFASIGFVDQNEYGLVYNWVTKQITDDVRHGGAHVIGFWNSFVTFPSIVRTIEFSTRIGMATSEPLHTRTKEGLGLHLSISYQYQLHMEELPQLYALTNVNYENLFSRIARDKLLEVAAEYEGPQYWQKREEIGTRMREEVSEKLKKTCSKLWGLQLLNIELPDKYEHSITMTQVQNQIIRTRQSQQRAASIRADTEVMQAKFVADINIVGSEAEANYTLTTKRALAEAGRRKIEVEAEALEYVKGKMHLSPKGLVIYSDETAYGNLENATFLANVGNVRPMVPIGQGVQQGSLLSRGRQVLWAGTGGDESYNQATSRHSSMANQTNLLVEAEDQPDNVDDDLAQFDQPSVEGKTAKEADRLQAMVGAFFDDERHREQVLSNS